MVAGEARVAAVDTVIRELALVPCSAGAGASHSSGATSADAVGLCFFRIAADGGSCCVSSHLRSSSGDSHNDNNRWEARAMCSLI